MMYLVHFCFYVHTDMLNPYTDQKFHITMDLENLIYLKLNQITKFSQTSWGKNESQNILL